MKLDRQRIAYRRDLPPLWMLVMMAGLGPLAMNIILPAGPAVMHDLGTDYGVAQLVLTLYLAATAISQLFIGSWSDRVGRRPMILLGFVLFSLGSLMCAVAPSIGWLLVGRVIQGLGGSVGIALSRVIIRDVHEMDEAASLIGYVTMAMVVVPMVGPYFGGLLVDHGSWQGIYWLLFLLSTLMLVVCFYTLHETHQPGQSDGPEQGDDYASAARSLFSDREFVRHLLLLSLASGMYFVFLGGAPYVYTELMSVTATALGLYLMFNAVGYSLGNFLSGRYAKRVGIRVLIFAGLLMTGLGLLLLWLGYGTLSPLAMALPMMVITFSNGLILPNATAAAISAKPRLSGMASGFCGFMQIAVGTLLTLIIGFWQNDDQWRLYALITLSGVGSILAYVLIRKND
ncbi:multidrug effflux MFS transporter [Granulosicoccaceae sp. 1_MG-2023]|nr:multidrug effflux MFS transporter [Granulosicoccaceae sp. 1_MG-2023]